MGDLFVIFAGELINRQETLIGVEAELASVVVGEIPCVGAVAYDENLDEAKQRLAISIAGIDLVIHDLLHGAAGTDGHCF
jgi:hypothetical protein